MSKLELGFLIKSKLQFPKIISAPKYEQGKLKIKPRHNELIKTLFIKIDSPENIIHFDESVMTILPLNLQKHFNNDCQPYLRNTYTNSSFLEAILLCFDNELNLVNSETARKYIIGQYLSVLDSDIKINNFWKENPSNKSEFKRQLYGNGKCDILGKMLSNSLDLNIILVNCETNEMNFISDLIFKNNKTIIFIVKKYGRYFPLMSLLGSLYDIKEEEIISILEELSIIEKVFSESSESDD